MAEIKFIADINLSNNQLTNVKLQNLTSDPSGLAGEGQIYYDSSANVIKFHTGSDNWVALSSASGDITAVTAGNGLTGGGTSGGVSLAVGAGTGITVNSGDVAVTAAQTGITSVFNTGLKVGYADAGANIDFSTDNAIIFDIDGTQQIKLQDGALVPITDNDIDLGTSSVEFKNAYFDGTVTSDAFAGPLTGDVTGNADTATTLATARNIGGVSFDGSGNINLPGVNTSGNQDTSGTAAVATTVTVADESSDTTCFPLFATAATGDLGPKSGSNLTFNSSSGALTASSFVGDLTGDVTGNADTATVATTVTITDNESTDEDNPIVFVAGGDVDGGNLGLETDGNAHYNPSTGKITATSFAGNLTGNVTGNTSGSSGSCTGNAATATALATARNINGVSFDGTANITVTAAGSTLSDTVTVAKGGTGATSFADKSVIITQDSGTDTLAAVAMTSSGQLLIGGSSGPAVGTLTAGSNITITNSDGGISIAGTANDDVSVANLKTRLAGGFGSNAVTIGDSNDVVTIGNDLVVTGDLTVSGDTTTVNTATLSVEDPLIVLASGNSGDSVDTGFYSKYVESSTTKYAGLFRDVSASGNPFIFFDGLQAEPGTTVNTSGTGYDLADISAGAITSADGFVGNLEGNVTGNVTGNTSGSSGSCTGNAATATALATARTINGTSFDGTGNITLGNDSVTNAMMADDAIDTAQLADGAVNTARLAADAVTGAKIADDAIDSEHYTDGSIDTAHIGDDQVTYAKIQNVSATNVVLGRDSAGAGVIEEISASALRTIINVENGATADQSKSDIDGLAITTVGTLDTGDATAIVSAASTSAAGKVELATTAEALAGTDTSRAVTAAGLAARSFKTTIGDGSDTDIDVTHNLGTRDVIVQLYDSSSYETVYAQVVRTDANTVTIDTNVAATSNDITVLITKVD
jgi:hypothetical protein|tara:strand:+ start:203 stop:2992 length:2790 start_codon:yes stop_codon:yes gene_type:complete